MANTTIREEKISNPWNDACSGGGFVKFEKDIMKMVIITNWQLALVTKEFTPGDKKEAWELTADVIEENGKAIDATMSTSSKPFLYKLKPILEHKDPSSKVKLQVVKVGDGKTTAYSVVELKM